MENQDEPSIQPDYSFILNQPGEAPQPLPPVGGKSHKKWIIIGAILVIFMVGLTGVALFANSKMQSNQATSTQAVDIPPNTNPVDSFLAAIKAQDYQKAANLLPGNEDVKQASATNIKKTFSPIDMTTCKVSALKGNKVNSFSDLTCRQAQNDYGVKMEFNIVQDGDTPIILSSTLKVVN